MTPIAESNPKSATTASRGSSLQAVVSTLALTLAFLVISVGYGRYQFGSVPATVAYLRGEHLFADEPARSIDGVRAGGQAIIRYTLTNLTRHPITLVGMTASCTCTEFEDLPITLAASEAKKVSAKVTISGGESGLSGSIRLFTNDLRAREIVLAYSLRVAPTRPSDAHRAD